jgi:hypothetical protein
MVDHGTPQQGPAMADLDLITTQRAEAHHGLIRQLHGVRPNSTPSVALGSWRERGQGRLGLGARIGT